MIKNLKNYQIHQQNNQFFLTLDWKTHEITRSSLDLDQIQHLIEEIQQQKTIEPNQHEQLEEIKNYINQQQETQLSERDSKDNVQDYIDLEDHLNRIIQGIFKLSFLENNQKLAEFLGYPELQLKCEKIEEKKQNTKLNQFQYNQTQQHLKNITDLTYNLESYYKYIVVQKHSFWGNSDVPLVIEKNFFLYILKPVDHKAYKIPINNNNLQIKWLGQGKNDRHEFELAFIKKGKQQKIQLGSSDLKKVKIWYDHLQQSLFQNNNSSDQEIIQMEQDFKKPIIEKADHIINKQINGIFKQETKFDKKEIQLQNEDQITLNIFNYLQNKEIQKEQIKKIEELIIQKSQHILNCIQNKHNLEVGIQSQQEQISIYGFINDDDNEGDNKIDKINTDDDKNLDYSQQKDNIKTNYKEKKSKKEHNQLWFNKDYLPVEKHKGQNNGLHFINKDFLKVQDSIYSTMIRRFGKVLFSGQPIFSISMPAVMFQAESMLERTAYTFGHNYYLNYAANTDNIAESIKFMTCFYQASFIIAIAQQMPLNPILGETFQGRINGDPIYFEQICHHPPISYYYMVGQNYKLYSPHQPQASLSLTQVEGKQTGHPIMELRNGKKIYYMWFPIRIKGLIIGDRIVQAAGKSFCFEPESRIICELNYDKNVSKNQFFNNIQNSYDVISGGIYKVTQNCIEKFIKAHKFNKQQNFNNLSIHLESEVEEIISKAEGDYKDYLSFDGIKYWNGQNQRPFVVQMENYSLPSDSRYRLDSLAIRQGETQNADNYKNELESVQRKDKKLRIKHSKKK